MEMIHKTAIIHKNVEIGDNVYIGPYSVIGANGFFKNSNLRNGKGKIIIKDNVIIGSHVTINIGEDGVTQIGDNCKIMNHANVGHDCIVGDNCIIGEKASLAGFATLEDYVNLGSGAMVRNRITVGEGCMIGMGAMVIKNTGYWGVYSGVPAKALKFNRIGADRNNIKGAYLKWLKSE